MKEISKREHECCTNCGCDSLGRREFIKIAGLGAVAASTNGLPVMAGPFEIDPDNEYLKTIPVDKKLDPKWVQSLYQRGTKETYTDPGALRRIGMPVGGIGAGMVYLSGDGRLWMWDVFNKKYPRGLMGRDAGGDTYLHPFEVIQPFGQGFELRWQRGTNSETRSLDCDGFSEVTFDGRYPMGLVRYRDEECPVAVQLEAFSPFIPLDLENSTYPATVMRFTVTNESDEPVTASIAGWTDNPVCLYTGQHRDTQLGNRVRQAGPITLLECRAEEPTRERPPQGRPDILFEDFETADYDGWEVTGDAFGAGPIATDDIPDYQGDVNGVGQRVVNSHASAPGESVTDKDRATGTLLSRPFKIERNYIAMRIGGGRHEGALNADELLAGKQPTDQNKRRTGVYLLVDGKVVRSLTGHNHNRMRDDSMDVSSLQGKTGRLMIVDSVSGPWGNIGVDQIVFTDRQVKPDAGPLLQRHDYGTFALAAVGGADAANASVSGTNFFDAGPEEAVQPHGQPLIGSLVKSVQLGPGESKTVSFIVAWHFPNLNVEQMGDVGWWYDARFRDAADVAGTVAGKLESLYEQTRLWVDTWYDSTLPYWLLDRAMANTSTLATTVCYLFRDGRVYGWEGVNCCAGTCTHVWHYAQSPGRLFPQIERNLRRRVDFGLGQHPNGAISHRTYRDHGSAHADDGHCGRILGVYRDHQMSPDDSFLRELWPKIKKAIEFLFTRDPNGDGILDGPQPNTLDAEWFGQISFTSSLHIAAMRAGERMAREIGDEQLADRCKAIADAGRESILRLFNGEYFYQIEDEQHKDAIGIGPGCYIDQIFGQTWAHWTNLGVIFDREKQLSSLRSLWKYNFVPDVGPFREKFKRGRWYAVAGDAGLIMCSWPREQIDPAKKKHWQYGYFNECMTGFEYQAAAHMIWEGLDQPDLLKYGLAVTRAIHDRYNAALRNPYNEIECSDHYARAMASYGVFQAVCGFNCHGPAGHIEFSPRLNPQNFRAPFTTATGWGTFQHRIENDVFSAELDIKWGEVSIQTLRLSLPAESFTKLEARHDNEQLAATAVNRNGVVDVSFTDRTTLRAGERLTVVIRK